MELATVVDLWEGVALAGMGLCWVRSKVQHIYNSWPGEKQMLGYLGMFGLAVAASIMMFGYMFAWPHLQKLFE